jgi:hypothetical protein
MNVLFFLLKKIVHYDVTSEERREFFLLDFLSIDKCIVGEYVVKQYVGIFERTF